MLRKLLIYILLTAIILIVTGCTTQSNKEVSVKEEIKITDEEILQIANKDAKEECDNIKNVSIFKRYKNYTALIEVILDSNRQLFMYYNLKTNIVCWVPSGTMFVDSCKFINDYCFELKMTGYSSEFYCSYAPYKKHYRIALDEEGNYEVIGYNKDIWIPLEESIDFGEGGKFVNYDLKDIRISSYGLQLEFDRDNNAYLDFRPRIVTGFNNDKFIIELHDTKVSDKQKIYNLMNYNDRISDIQIVEEGKNTRLILTLINDMKFYRIKSGYKIEFEFHTDADGLVEVS
ncbi:hypothetical protein PV797_12835 [Clostridiaceae bacterium M8S5]|nr:hypothetical protein PV797_12835 [Clostridiaceae bacterium M8S5]